MVLLVMCVGYFLVLLDVTIVNIALPSISSGIGASISDLQWVLDGYALALACLMLTGGSIGDLRGHKRVVLSGLSLFGAASLGCGLSGTIGVLVAFRVLQGVGAALMLPGTLAVISHAYPGRREQAQAIGVWAGVGSSALVAGPLLGGLLVQTLGWRWVFLLNVPLVSLATVGTALVVHESRSDRPQRLDWRGALLAAALLGGLTFAFIQGGRHGVDAWTLGAITIAVAATVAFIAVERRAAAPMLPLELFRVRAFTTANTVAGAMNLATLGLLFVMTLYLQNVRHHSALSAGIALLPLFLPLSVIAPIGGRITARTGPKAPMLVGLIAAAAGVSLLVLADGTSSYPTLMPALLLWGMGLAVLTPAVVAAAIASVPAERAGLASAVNNTARQAAGAIGIAAFGALVAHPGATPFLSGMHTGAVVAATLFLIAAGATAILIRPPSGT